MPVLKDIAFTLELNRVLQRQGFKDSSRIRPEMRDKIDSLIQEVDRQHLIESAVTYEVYRVAGIGPERISLEGGLTLEGTLLPSRVPDAGKLIVLVATIGPRLETLAKGWSQSGETLKGMLLDGIGSVAMHSITQEACTVVFRSVVGDHANPGPTYSPGMAGFPLTEQGNIMGLAKASRIGVGLTSSGMMVPRKSTSRVLGIGPQVRSQPA